MRMELCRTEFQKSCILFAKNWTKCFQRKKSGKITRCLQPTACTAAEASRGGKRPRAQARLPDGAWRCSQRRWAGMLRCRCSARCRYPRVWEARESACASAGLVPQRAHTHPRLITAVFIRLDQESGGLGGRRQRWQEPDRHGARALRRRLHPASASLRRTCRARTSPTRARSP